MPCAQPIPAWRPANGGPLKFQPPNNGRAYTPINIPCGYCILCREEYARQTAVRITHEATRWEQSSFLTLTYNEANIPTYGSLNYEHLTTFWKRLRKRVGKLRYYAVGEYGDRTLRPHYHACLFGHAFTENRVIVKTTPHLLWTTAELDQVWGHGRVTVGTLNFQTARYTASYVMKKLRQKQKYVRTDEETGELIPIEQPRAFMSRNIGREWWQEWHQQTHDHDYVIIDGRKQKPPRAYDKWTKDKAPEVLEKIKEKRKTAAVKLTNEQNRARAENAHARIRNKNKTV
ncbi:MAG: replication initiator protein [Microvirus sp.]|nr:MAG: replication initiator protein [Microvirus sp.]